MALNKEKFQQIDTFYIYVIYDNFNPLSLLQLEY